MTIQNIIIFNIIEQFLNVFRDQPKKNPTKNRLKIEQRDHTTQVKLKPTVGAFA